MYKPETGLIHTGNEWNETRAVVPPIFQTSTYYAPDDPADYSKDSVTPNAPFFYQRHGNPVTNQAAAIIAELEKTEAALLGSTGMAAISTAVLAHVKAGDHVIAQNIHYSAVNMLFNEMLPAFGVEVTRVDQINNAAFEQAVRPNTTLIYVETPSNPTLEITDLAFIGALGKKYGAITMCDNTFSSPLNQRPHELGIDVVLHSATKYLGGHSDLTAGAICASKDFIEKAWKKLIILGGALAPMDAWLLLKGLRTLSLRMAQINSNALALATWFESQKGIKKVLYAGLPSHPQFKLAQRQMTGFGGMLCIEVVGDTEDEQFEHAQAVLRQLHLFSNAASLGGVESLAVHPTSMWGIRHNQERKAQTGMNDGMIRISVGIEHSDDLIADFQQALSTIAI
ncbi:methionine-gamma-lyase [bacterium A37T11]|nr:methionine-gamma-lyase [bacterium A37T11]